ncbi:protein translocase subunit SecF, partial [Candidatus Parcubacteria bacterium]|nr:protein translocase subunit SecF [Candidatus Parcubacteria bacterium]
MFVVQYRKIFFALSIILMAISIAAMFYYGFNFGIDFRGGTISQVSYKGERPLQAEVQEDLTKLGFG